MSGIEPIILASLAGIGEAAAGVGTAIGSAVGGTGAAAAGAGAASAGELALLASASQGLTAAGGAGLTASQAIAGTSALASAAGAGAQLLAEPPKFELPQAPVRDTAKQEADARSAMLKRRGRAATLLTGSQGVTSSPTLGSPALTGTA